MHHHLHWYGLFLVTEAPGEFIFSVSHERRLPLLLLNLNEGLQVTFLKDIYRTCTNQLIVLCVLVGQESFLVVLDMTA